MVRQQIITPASFQPISVAYAKKALKLPTDEVEDDLLAVFIAAAADTASNHTGILPVKTELANYFNEAWPVNLIFWQAHPLLDVTSVQYMPEGSTDYQTLDASNYVLDKYASPARVKLVGEDLPAINTDHPEAIKVTFTAGYKDTEDESEAQAAIPGSYKQAVALIAAHWYLYRADYPKKNLPSAAEVLLNQLKTAWV